MQIMGEAVSLHNLILTKNLSTMFVLHVYGMI